MLVLRKLVAASLKLLSRRALLTSLSRMLGSLTAGIDNSARMLNRLKSGNSCSSIL